MNFIQIEFLWFVATVFVVYWLLGQLRRGRMWQNLLLVVASAVFYGWVHPWFLLLLSASAGLDFVVGQLIETHRRHRDHLLMLSLAGNLGMLAYFKYFNFFVSNVVDGLALLGVQADLRTLAIVLPVGISFYTFQTMSYTIDIYRGELKPRRSFLDYLVFVSFFPQLVAGPIERAGRLLPQLERPRRFDPAQILSGITLASWGGFKKLVVADTLAPYIDKVFVLEEPSGPLIWSASIAFSIQIFADFSGYTDIARGTARMFGIELMRNFRSPFLAASTPEFWQRWHISLSFWIRDYLLVPLLGTASQLSRSRFFGATLLTFTIIGLWHGASWNFVLFGALHGVAMIVYTLLGRALPRPLLALSWGRPLAIVLHFVAVSVPGSMLFRETHPARIVHHLTTPPLTATPDEWIATSVLLGVTALCAAPLVASHAIERWVLPRVQGTVWLLPMQTSTWAISGVGMFVFYRVNTYDFIYFQF
ncbi:MAG TPA: MBOAT family protein [Deltaproteobacteria bacterium]|nr:MBOAT family protein [Deltaproteobacteria bacterium]